MSFVFRSIKSNVPSSLSLDPRVKIFILLSSSIISISINDLSLLLTLNIVVLLVIFSNQLLESAIRYIKSLIWLIIPIFFLQIFFSPYKIYPLVVIPSNWKILSGFVLISIDSIIYASIIVLRVLFLALSSITFSFTTNSNDFLRALQKFGIPYEIAITTGLVIYFLPMVINESNDIRNALTIRGLSINKGPLFFRIKTFNVLISAILLSFIEKSYYQVIAMDSRGFNTNKKRTIMKDLHLKVTDVFIFFISLILVIGIFYYFWDAINFPKDVW